MTPRWGEVPVNYQLTIMTDPFCKLVIPEARPYGDDTKVTGEFWFNDQIRYSFETRTERFFESSGVSGDVVDVLIDWVTENGGEADGIRQVVALDIGSGAHAITIDLNNAAALGRWGDSGNGGTMGDATGESVHAKLSTLDRYFQTATMDSVTTPTLEIAEYSSSGKYGPLQVIPEQPSLVFDSESQTSVFDSSLTFIEVASIDQALDTSNQEDR